MEIEWEELLCPPDSPLTTSSLISGVAKTAEAFSSPVPPLFAHCLRDALHALDLSEGITRGVAKKSPGSIMDFEHASMMNGMIPAQS